jgi:hypothetical protein
MFSVKIRASLLAGFLLLFIPWRLRRFRNGWPIFLVVLAVLLAGVAVSGCSAPGAQTVGTPVGDSNISITGAATNGSQTLTHAITVTLNVKSLF